MFGFIFTFLLPDILRVIAILLLQVHTVNKFDIEKKKYLSNSILLICF
jgi:hypothetical protein